jgi:hypothetical protein
MPPNLTPQTPERIPVPSVERLPNIEQVPVGHVESSPETVSPATTAGSAPVAVPAAPPVSPADAVQKRVEQVLEEGLGDIYQKLDPATQAKFRHEGEVTAQRVTELLKQAAVKVVEVLRVIRRWLAMLPGVSDLFIESQAKLKAEKLMKLK